MKDIFESKKKRKERCKKKTKYLFLFTFQNSLLNAFEDILDEYFYDRKRRKENIQKIWFCSLNDSCVELDNKSQKLNRSDQLDKSRYSQTNL